MKNRLDETVFRAYEERHSPSINRNYKSAEKIPYLRRPLAPQLDSVTDFRGVDPVGEQEPNDAVLLALLTQLARHLIRSRTNPYRVRRDRSQSVKTLDHYVPRIDYELHWSALSLWHRRFQNWPAVVRKGEALHPATLALIVTMRSAAQWQGRPRAHSSEEYDHLSDDQQVCNTIAERMRAWIAQPANTVLVKTWEGRLDQDKKNFQARCTPTSESSPQQLLRFDLFYAGQTGPDRGFGSIPSALVQEDVDRLQVALKNSANFRGQLIELHPYADFSVTWVIPGVILLPASAGSPWRLLNEVETCWRNIAGQRFGRLQSDNLMMQGNYRYVTEEQHMLDPLWLQLNNAATYMFNTRLILDSSLEAITSPESFNHQHSNSKKLHRGELCEQ